jgi:hypothetical protein
MSRSALLGYTGFVGGNINRQHKFDALYNSRNIDEIRGEHFHLMIVSAVQAKKWWANLHPNEDWQRIAYLLDTLREVNADHVVVISTIDVLPKARGIDERTDPHISTGEPYGLHRLRFEDELRSMYEQSTIIRLPGLFGRGLQKNVIYDLLNNNQQEKINPASSYQYYNLDRLWRDIETTLSAGLDLVHLFTQPVTSSEIIERFFPGAIVGSDPYTEAHYDFQTCHAAVFGGIGRYIQSADEVLDDMKMFIKAYRAGLK